MNWHAPDIPEKYRKLYEKGRTGKAKAAIRAMCAMCCGFDANEVERCTATGCPLFNLRNLTAQSQTESVDREKRRQRALASGQRPPKRPPVDGRGDQPDGQISSATEPPGGVIPVEPAAIRSLPASVELTSHVYQLRCEPRELLGHAVVD